MKNFKKVIASACLMASSSMFGFMTIGQYDQKTNFGTRWNDGRIVTVYQKRALSVAKMNAEFRGGARTCNALKAAGGIRDCKNYGISVVRDIDAPAGVGALSF